MEQKVQNHCACAENAKPPRVRITMGAGKPERVPDTHAASKQLCKPPHLRNKIIVDVHTYATVQQHEGNNTHNI